MEQLHELVYETEPACVDGVTSGPVVLQHHEGATHKGDMFTKYMAAARVNLTRI